MDIGRMLLIVFVGFFMSFIIGKICVTFKLLGISPFLNILVKKGNTILPINDDSKLWIV